MPGWLDAKRYWQSSSQVCGLTAYRPQRTEGVSDQSDAGRQSVTQYEAWKVKFGVFFSLPEKVHVSASVPHRRRDEKREVRRQNMGEAGTKTMRGKEIKKPNREMFSQRRNQEK